MKKEPVVLEGSNTAFFMGTGAYMQVTGNLDRKDFSVRSEAHVE